MIIMEIKAILILVITAHAYTASSKDEDPLKELFLHSLHHKEIKCSLPPECRHAHLENIFIHSQDLKDTNCVLPKNCHDQVITSFLIKTQAPKDEWMNGPHIDQSPNCTVSNSSVLQQQHNISLSISCKAVEFLKGPLVTRFMPSFYIFIILISLPLNALALVTFTCRIREKKPAVIYMSHLACVDLLFALLLPLKIHYQLNASDWLFGEAACRVLTAAYYCYMYCSILLMMCMSVDRLLGVALPFASLTCRSTRKASCVCVLVWLLALAGTVPLLSMRQTFPVKNVGMTCHDALQQDSTEHFYLYLFFILSCLYFFVPLVITLVSYSTIIYVLSVKSDRISSSSSNRNRAVFMTVSVLIEFLVCFGPTNGILLYHCIRLATGKDSEGDSSYASYMLAVCLGSASVFLDPLLYYYGSSHYRQIIQSVLRKAKEKTPPCNTPDTKARSAVTCEV